MGMQKEVHARPALGLAGAFYDTSVRRVTAYRLAGDPEHQVIGRVAQLNPDGSIAAGLGEDAPFAGILCNPAAQARQSLRASLFLTVGATVEAADMGRICVTVETKAEAGDSVAYDVHTGKILVRGKKAEAVGKLIEGATFFTGAEAGGIAVVQL